MKDSVINMYGLFNLCLWGMFVVGAAGMFGEPLSKWFFLIPGLLSLMYAGAVHSMTERKR